MIKIIPANKRIPIEGDIWGAARRFIMSCERIPLTPEQLDQVIYDVAHHLQRIRNIRNTERTNVATT